MDECNGYTGWWFTWLAEGKVNPEDYDGIEVQPVRTYRINDTDGTFVEPCEPDEAEFWSAYAHCKAGGVECIGDFADEQDAWLYALLVGLTHKWRYV